MAEVVLRAHLAQAGLDEKVIVDSAGTGDWHVGERMNSRARAQLAQRGYNGEAHRARQFEASWLPERDLVLAMDSINLKAIRSLPGTTGGDASRIRLFGDAGRLGGVDVPDPYGGNSAEFARVLDLLESAMPSLVPQLADIVIVG
jgi:protein-tyrosine phosphatase